MIYLTDEKITENLNTEIIGRNVIVKQEVNSTNDLAKELAKGGAPDGTLVLAHSQTSGRGRIGRSFFSPLGSGIYATLILRPNVPLQDITLITEMASLGILNAIERVCSLKAQIKWVNDIFINGKKVCGILTEANINPELKNADYIILGFGINVKAATFPKDLEGIATSLENECAFAVSKTALLREILRELDQLYKTFETGDFLDEYRRRSWVLGKDIRVFCGDESFLAKALAIDDRGGLVIERNNKQETLYFGEVSIRTVKNDC